MKLRGLFVTDLDGTLLDEDRRVAPRNLAAMREAARRGVAVALVTGRRQSSLTAEHAKLDGLRYRVATSNGSVVLREDNRSLETVRSLGWELAEALALESRLLHAPLICITAGALPPRPPEGPPDCFVLTPGNRAWTQTWSWTDPSSHRPVEREAARAQSLVHVALHVATRAEAEELTEAVGPHLSAEAEQHVVVAPHGPGALLEVVPRGGKAWALRYFAESLGVPQQATAAIGDEINDLVLLDSAAHPFAVGGSVLAARRPAATEVSEARDGAVADAIEEFLARLA